MEDKKFMNYCLTCNRHFWGDANATQCDECGEAKKYPIGGYAPGSYHNRCVTCERSFFGDKRAVQCEPCAMKDKEAFDALSPEEQQEVMKRNGEIAAKLFAEARHPSKSAGVKDISYDAELQFKDVPEPIGSFILAQNDIEYTQTANGAYWHYSAVCALLGRYAQEKAAGAKGAVWVKASERLPEPFKVVPCKYTPDSPDPRKDTELHWGFVSKNDSWDRGWKNHQVEWLDESPSLAPDQSGKEDDAIAFAEYAVEKCWFDEEYKLWNTHDESADPFRFSTKELYDIYQSKNK